MLRAGYRDKSGHAFLLRPDSKAAAIRFGTGFVVPRTVPRTVSPLYISILNVCLEGDDASTVHPMYCYRIGQNQVS